MGKTVTKHDLETKHFPRGAENKRNTKVTQRLTNTVEQARQGKANMQDNKHDVTSKSYLRSHCIDPKNEVFAVAKSLKCACIPIHVIKKTWESSYKVT